MKPPTSLLLSNSPLTCQTLKETLARALTNSNPSPTKLLQHHALILTSGLHQNLHLSSILISLYASFRRLPSSIAVFKTLIPVPDKPLIWNSLVRSSISNHRPDLALGFFKEMVKLSPSGPDFISLNLAINASIQIGDFYLGFCLASLAWKRGMISQPLVSTPLIVLYRKFGDIECARKLFDEMPERDLVSWNAMISCCSLEKEFSNAIGLFKEMKMDCFIAPSDITIVTLVSSCGRIGSLEHGEIFHGEAIKLGLDSSICISNALMEMYIQCNHLDSAARVFEMMPQRDSISWSTIIGGFLRHNRPHDSIKIFNRMISKSNIVPTRSVLLNVLHACAEIGDWHQGKKIQENFLGNFVEIDALVVTTLIFMYAKCGRIDLAYEMINENMMVNSDKIAWNALIKGCAESGNLHKVVNFSMEMQRRWISLDKITLLTFISISSSLPCLNMGMAIHAQCLTRGFSRERTILNSLIDMYSKCGNIEDSGKIFDDMEDKDVVAWSSMMNAYDCHGRIKDVLKLFTLMKNSGAKPNHFTFISVLSACSHGGYINEAWKLFKSMKVDYGLDPCMEHYACIVDLLARGDYIYQAFEFIESLPSTTCNRCLLLRNLMNTCSLSGNWVIGEVLGKLLFQLEPQNASNYLILANIYMSVGRRDEANDVLRAMRELGLEKEHGLSWCMEG